MRLLSEGYLVVCHTALARRFSLIRERMWAGRFKENGGMGLVGGVEFFAADCIELVKLDMATSISFGVLSFMLRLVSFVRRF